MKALLRPACTIQGWLYTLRYWFQGGVLTFSVSGHPYIQGESYKGDRDGIPVLVEPLVCERCGAISEAWKLW